MRRGSKSADDLDRQYSLEESYEPHDVGEAHVRARVSDVGLDAVQWGIDEREDEGNLIYDDKLDLRLLDDDSELRGLCEVKTKRNEDWFGVINVRHYRKYLDWALQTDVPTFIWMGYLDDSSDTTTVERQTCIPLEPWDAFVAVQNGAHLSYDAGDTRGYVEDHVEQSPQVDRVFKAPDGNRVIAFDEDAFVGWTRMMYLLGDAR